MIDCDNLIIFDYGTDTMASKRGGDASSAMVAVPSNKRSKNEIVAVNGGRSQAIMATVGSVLNQL